MLTSKERALLRAKANPLDTTLIVGKGGVTEQVVAEAEILLDAKELVKGKVLESAMVTPREACDAICEATGAEGIQIVGTKFVFYRKSEKLEQRKSASTTAKKKENPVRAGVQARRKRAKEEKEKRRQRYHDEAVQTAIRRRIERENGNA